MIANSFNAWTDPWLPLRRLDDTETVVSLREAFTHADAFADLGAALTPLDRDSLYRFLPALGAVIARYVDADEESVAAGVFPLVAIAEFEAEHLDRFNLVGDRPFMQRWDHAQSELSCLTPEAERDAVKRKAKDEAEDEVQNGPTPNDKAEISKRSTAIFSQMVIDLKLTKDEALLPINQLHPHVPGGSSSQWAVRRDSKTSIDWATACLLLVTTWFQTRKGNSQDPWGTPLTAGSAASWKHAALAIHLLGDTLGDTLYANMVDAWIDRDDLPVFLDHTTMPTDVAITETDSLWRFTYAKTLPLLHAVDGALVRFALGPDATIPVPPLGTDEKESLKAVHEGDHTRLYYERTQKDGSVVREPVKSLGAALGTVEGATRWFLDEGRVQEGLLANRSIERLGGPRSTSDWSAYRLGVFNEAADRKGMTRNWANWSTIPMRASGYDPLAVAGINTVLGYINECRNAYFYALKQATGDAKPPMLLRAQADLLSAVAPVVAAAVQAAADGANDDVDARLNAARAIATKSFRAAVAPLTTPEGIALVARAIGWYDRRVSKLLRELTQPEAPAVAA